MINRPREGNEGDDVDLHISYIVDHMMELSREETDAFDPIEYAKSQRMNIPPEREEDVRRAVMAAKAMKRYGPGGTDTIPDSELN